MGKEDFISIFELTLVSADLDIIGLTLLDNDTAQIEFKGGGKRKVNIEADSYKGIILDVLKNVE